MNNTEYFNSFDRIIISGASGAVGSYILRQLLNSQKQEIVCIFRTPQSYKRLIDNILPDANGRIIPIYADLCDSDLVDIVRKEVPRSRHCLAIHCAADVSWTKSDAVISPINIDGTLRFASLAVELSQLKPTFAMLSTAFADFEQGEHRNSYESTKAIAEKEIINKYSGLINICILRASLIVGDSLSGWIGRFNGLYPLIRLVAFADTPCVIGSAHYPIDIAPVDWITDELFNGILHAQDSNNPTIITACAGSKSITMNDVVRIVQDKANSFLIRAGHPPNPPISVVSRRQYDFLIRTSKTLSMDDDFYHMERIGSIMDGYIIHTETSRQIIPDNLNTPPPDPIVFLPNIVDFWLHKHSDRLLKRREIPWLRWQNEAITSTQ